jgi:hypothetical protein
MNMKNYGTIRLEVYRFRLMIRVIGHNSNLMTHFRKSGFLLLYN